MADTKPPAPPEALPLGTWTTDPRVTVTTSKGSFVVELEPNSAPVTSINFLAYVNTGFFNNLLFHRVIPGFVVQAGGFTSGLNRREPTYPPLPLESNTSLSNTRGTLAMARTTDPNSATSQFFVNLANNSADLDYVSNSNPGYAVFGRVVSGMSVIDKIAQVATTSRGGFDDVPTRDVLITGTTTSRTGVVHSKNGVVLVGGVERNADWAYSSDGGQTWTNGTTSFEFKLTAGAYKAADVRIRQTDAAGNVSVAGVTGASIVVRAGAAILGDARANVLNGTAKNDYMFGLAGRDTLKGNGGHDNLDGGSGNDTLIGGVGNDTYHVRDLADVVREAAGGGTDSVRSYVTAYTLPSFVEYARIVATGAANLTGNELNNVLHAGVGDNVLNGGDGIDTVSYAAGTTGNSGVTVSLAVSAAQDTGGSGSDTLENIERLIGSAFADTLIGNDLDNVLSGSGGQDTLTGGAGNDIFDFNALADSGSNTGTADIITDFSVGDLLDLSTIDAKTTTAAVNDAFSAVFVDTFTAPGQLKFVDGVLYANTDNNFATSEFAINLTGVLALSASDLIL